MKNFAKSKGKRMKMAVDYNDLLYEKAQKEYDDLIAELKELPSEQVVERAYEILILVCFKQL